MFICELWDYGVLYVELSKNINVIINWLMKCSVAVDEPIDDNMLLYNDCSVINVQYCVTQEYLYLKVNQHLYWITLISYVFINNNNDDQMR